MSYHIEYTNQALEDLKTYKRSGERKLLVKIESLIAEIKDHPYSGTGHPEPLKYEMSGYWSRHINKKNRIIYRVEEDRIVVLVVQLRQHYKDK